MNEDAFIADVPKKKRWPVRVTLYQTFVLFSIVAAVLLLRSIEREQVELRTKRATLFSLNHDLYIDYPNRMASIKKPLANPDEFSWSVYIPPRARGKLFVEGQCIEELNSGIHQIRARILKVPLQGVPESITIEKIVVDEQAKDVHVNLSIQQMFDDIDITEPTTVALGAKLPLLASPGGEENQIWIEAN